ncbi:MAG: biopolymer transporter ExbD [Sulfurospirillaceae bacterium]|nr:biopolymer transporter ExbD [Sulfurospirillaceae bacterium]
MKVQKFDSINVVPFIDIILVLLVIVLTTATFVAKGIIPVDLSKSKNSTVLKQKQQQPLVITIKQNGEIFFDKIQVARDHVKSMLALYKTDTEIRLNCDKSTKFDNFVYMLDILKQNGYKNLGIITQHE